MSLAADIVYRYRIWIAVALSAPGLVAIALAHRSPHAIDTAELTTVNLIAAACLWIGALMKIQGDISGMPGTRFAGSVCAIFAFLRLIFDAMPPQFAWLEAIALGVLSYVVAGATVPIRSMREAIVGERLYWLAGIGTLAQGLSFLWPDGPRYAGIGWLLLVATYVALPRLAAR